MTIWEYKCIEIQKDDDIMLVLTQQGLEGWKHGLLELLVMETLV